MVGLPALGIACGCPSAGCRCPVSRPATGPVRSAVLRFALQNHSPLVAESCKACGGSEMLHRAGHAVFADPLCANTKPTNVQPRPSPAWRASRYFEHQSEVKRPELVEARSASDVGMSTGTLTRRTGFAHPDPVRRPGVESATVCPQRPRSAGKRPRYSFRSTISPSRAR